MVPGHSLSTAEFLPRLVVFHWFLLQSAGLQARWVYVLRRRDGEMRCNVQGEEFKMHINASAIENITTTICAGSKVHAFYLDG